MNEPLASAAGNAVEVLNAVAYLDRRAARSAARRGRASRSPREMLTLGGLAETTADGEAMAREALDERPRRGDVSRRW